MIAKKLAARRESGFNAPFLPGHAAYLFLALVLGYQVERDGVERAGHDAKHAAQDERGDDVGEESDEAGAHAEHEVAHEVERLQADVGQEEALHIWEQAT